MPGRGDLNFDVLFNFKANNAEEIKKKIQELSKTVSLKVNIGNPSKIKQEAKQLEAIFTKNFNPKTNAINSIGLSSDLIKAGKSAQEVNSILAATGNTSESVFNQTNKNITNTTKGFERLKSAASTFTDSFKRTAMWSVESRIISGISSLIDELVDNSVQLDKILTNIRLVTDYTAQDMEKITSKANEFARQLNSTTSAVLEAETTFYQQGLGEKDVENMTKATIKAANISGVEAEEMSQYLTATVNAFNLKTTEAMDIVDQFSAIAASSATDFNEMSIAMQKVASQASAVGLGAKNTEAALATIQSTTRESAEAVGTSLKTILGRITAFKTDASGALTDDDGELFSAPDAEAALQRLGKAAGKTVSLFDYSSGSKELKDMSVIINEIGEAWENVEDKSVKAGVANALAGSRMQNRFLALFENFDTYQNLLEVANNSSGFGDTKQNVYAKSLEASKVEFSQSKQELSQSFVETGAIKGFYEILKDITDVITFLQKTFNAIPALIGVATIKMTGFQEVANKASVKTSVMQEDFRNIDSARVVGMTKAENQNYTNEALAQDQELFSRRRNLLNRRSQDFSDTANYSLSTAITTEAQKAQQGIVAADLLKIINNNPYDEAVIENANKTKAAQEIENKQQEETSKESSSEKNVSTMTIKAENVSISSVSSLKQQQQEQLQTNNVNSSDFNSNRARGLLNQTGRNAPKTPNQISSYLEQATQITGKDYKTILNQTKNKNKTNSNSIKKAFNQIKDEIRIDLEKYIQELGDGIDSASKQKTELSKEEVKNSNSNSAQESLNQNIGNETAQLQENTGQVQENTAVYEENAQAKQQQILETEQYLATLKESGNVTSSFTSNLEMLINAYKQGSISQQDFISSLKQIVAGERNASQSVNQLGDDMKSASTRGQGLTALASGVTSFATSVVMGQNAAQSFQSALSSMGTMLLFSAVSSIDLAKASQKYSDALKIQSTMTKGVTGAEEAETVAKESNILADEVAIGVSAAKTVQDAAETTGIGLKAKAIAILKAVTGDMTGLAILGATALLGLSSVIGNVSQKKEEENAALTENIEKYKEANTNIAESTTKLEENKKALLELELANPYDTLNNDTLDRIENLKKENEELERSIELEKQKKSAAAGESTKQTIKGSKIKFTNNEDLGYSEDEYVSVSQFLNQSQDKIDFLKSNSVNPSFTTERQDEAKAELSSYVLGLEQIYSQSLDELKIALEEGNKTAENKARENALLAMNMKNRAEGYQGRNTENYQNIVSLYGGTDTSKGISDMINNEIKNNNLILTEENKNKLIKSIRDQFFKGLKGSDIGVDDNILDDIIGNAIQQDYNSLKFGNNIGDVLSTTFTETIKNQSEAIQKTGEGMAKILSQGFVEASDIQDITKQWTERLGTDAIGSNWINQLSTALSAGELEKASESMQHLIDRDIELAIQNGTLTDATAKYYTQQLAVNGVVNAGEIVNQKLALAQEKTLLSTKDLGTAGTYMQQFGEHYKQSLGGIENAQRTFAIAWLQNLDSVTLDSWVGKINAGDNNVRAALLNMLQAAGVTAQALQELFAGENIDSNKLAQIIIDLVNTNFNFKNTKAYIDTNKELEDKVKAEKDAAKQRDKTIKNAEKTWKKAQKTWEKAQETYNDTIKDIAEEQWIADFKYEIEGLNAEIEKSTNLISALKDVLDLTYEQDYTGKLNLTQRYLNETSASLGKISSAMNIVLSKEPETADEYKEQAEALKELQDKYYEAKKDMIKYRRELAKIAAEGITNSVKNGSDALNDFIDSYKKKAGKNLFTNTSFEVGISSGFKLNKTAPEDAVERQRQENEELISLKEQFEASLSEIEEKERNKRKEEEDADRQERLEDAKETLEEAKETLEDARQTYVETIQNAHETYKQAVDTAETRYNNAIQSALTNTENWKNTTIEHINEVGVAVDDLAAKIASLNGQDVSKIEEGSNSTAFSVGGKIYYRSNENSEAIVDAEGKEVTDPAIKSAINNKEKNFNSYIENVNNRGVIETYTKRKNKGFIRDAQSIIMKDGTSAKVIDIGKSGTSATIQYTDSSGKTKELYLNGVTGKFSKTKPEYYDVSGEVGSDELLKEFRQQWGVPNSNYLRASGGSVQPKEQFLFNEPWISNKNELVAIDGKLYATKRNASSGQATQAVNDFNKKVDIISVKNAEKAGLYDSKKRNNLSSLIVPLDQKKKYEDGTATVSTSSNTVSANDPNAISKLLNKIYSQLEKTTTKTEKLLTTLLEKEDEKKDNNITNKTEKDTSLRDDDSKTQKEIDYNQKEHKLDGFKKDEESWEKYQKDITDTIEEDYTLGKTTWTDGIEENPLESYNLDEQKWTDMKDLVSDWMTKTKKVITDANEDIKAMQVEAPQVSEESWSNLQDTIVTLLQQTINTIDQVMKENKVDVNFVINTEVGNVAAGGTPAGDGGDIIGTARSLIGTPYVWGGSDLSAGGLDCSGFVSYVLNLVGYNVGRLTAQGLANFGTQVPIGEQQPGDLLLYGSSIGNITHAEFQSTDGKTIGSHGGTRNTASNPGRGVAEEVNKRKDLVMVRRPGPLPTYAKGTDYFNNIQTIDGVKKEDFNSATDYTEFDNGKFSTYKGNQDRFNGVAGENFKPEILVDKKTGNKFKISSPTLINTKDTDVIGEVDTSRLNYYYSGTPLTNKKYLAELSEAGRVFNIPLNFLLAIVDVETSNGTASDTWKYNSAGAYGLMQITKSALDDMKENNKICNELRQILKKHNVNLESARGGGEERYRDNIWVGVANLDEIRKRYKKTTLHALAQYYNGGNSGSKASIKYADLVISLMNKESFIKAAEEAGGLIGTGTSTAVSSKLGKALDEIGTKLKDNFSEKLFETNTSTSKIDPYTTLLKWKTLLPIQGYANGGSVYAGQVIRFNEDGVEAIVDTNGVSTLKGSIGKVSYDGQILTAKQTADLIDLVNNTDKSELGKKGDEFITNAIKENTKDLGAGYTQSVNVKGEYELKTPNGQIYTYVDKSSVDSIATAVKTGSTEQIQQSIETANLEKVQEEVKAITSALDTINNSIVKAGNLIAAEEQEKLASLSQNFEIMSADGTPSAALMDVLNIFKETSNKSMQTYGEGLLTYYASAVNTKEELYKKMSNSNLTADEYQAYQEAYDSITETLSTIGDKYKSLLDTHIATLVEINSIQINLLNSYKKQTKELAEAAKRLYAVTTSGEDLQLIAKRTMNSVTEGKTADTRQKQQYNKMEQEILATPKFNDLLWELKQRGFNSEDMFNVDGTINEGIRALVETGLVGSPAQKVEFLALLDGLEPIKKSLVTINEDNQNYFKTVQDAVAEIENTVEAATTRIDNNFAEELKLLEYNNTTALDTSKLIELGYQKINIYQQEYSEYQRIQEESKQGLEEAKNKAIDAYGEENFQAIIEKYFNATTGEFNLKGSKFFTDLYSGKGNYDETVLAAVKHASEMTEQSKIKDEAFLYDKTKVNQFVGKTENIDNADDSYLNNIFNDFKEILNINILEWESFSRDEKEDFLEQQRDISNDYGEQLNAIMDYEGSSAEEQKISNKLLEKQNEIAAERENQRASVNALIQESYKKITDELQDESDYINAVITKVQTTNNMLQEYYTVLRDIRQQQTDLKKELKTSMALSTYLDSESYLKMFNEQDYNKAMSALNTYKQTTKKALDDYTAKVNSLNQNNIYKAEYYETIYKNILEAEKEKVELVKLEYDYEKAKYELADAYANRDTRMFVGGTWRYVADPDKIETAVEAEETAKSALEEKQVQIEENEIMRANSEYLADLQNDSSRIQKAVEQINDKIEWFTSDFVSGKMRKEDLNYGADYILEFTPEELETTDNKTIVNFVSQVMAYYDKHIITMEDLIEILGGKDRIEAISNNANVKQKFAETPIGTKNYFEDVNFQKAYDNAKDRIAEKVPEEAKDESGKVITIEKEATNAELVHQLNDILKKLQNPDISGETFEYLSNLYFEGYDQFKNNKSDAPGDTNKFVYSQNADGSSALTNFTDYFQNSVPDSKSRLTFYSQDKGLKDINDEFYNIRMPVDPTKNTNDFKLEQDADGNSYKVYDFDNNGLQIQIIQKIDSQGNIQELTEEEQQKNLSSLEVGKALVYKHIEEDEKTNVLGEDGQLVPIENYGASYLPTIEELSTLLKEVIENGMITFAQNDSAIPKNLTNIDNAYIVLSDENIAEAMREDSENEKVRVPVQTSTQ